MKKILQSLILLSLFTLALSAIASFTAPTQVPPAGNTPSPINVGNDTQAKVGGLSVGGLLSTGYGIFNANVEIGGTLKVAGGNPAQDKVLASDNTGLASWKTLAELGGGGGGDSIWIRNSGDALIKPVAPNDSIWLGFDSTIYKSNTSANNNAVKFLHNTGGSANTNTFLGKTAGKLASISGDGNTGLGYAALENLSSGTNNTAVGAASLKIMTTGSENTAVGANTLLNNTTGSQNTVVGSNAGITAGGISNATAIGASANVNASNKVRIGNSAVQIIEGQVDWSFPSDRRIKENIKDVDLGLDFVNSLRPVTYKRIGGDDKINYGFIAQEVEALLNGKNTSIVMTDSSPEKMKTMSYTQMIAPMVKAIQEQQKEIELLKAEIELLKNK